MANRNSPCAVTAEIMFRLWRTAVALWISFIGVAKGPEALAAEQAAGRFDDHGAPGLRNHAGTASAESKTARLRA